MRGGVRSRLAVASRPARICPHGLRRHSAKCHSALRNHSDFFQCEDGFPKGPTILGASGSGFGDVAGLASHVDLYRSLPPARGAESFCRGRNSFSAHCSDDGSGGAAAACSPERSHASGRHARLRSPAHVVAISLSFCRDPLAVCTPD